MVRARALSVALHITTLRQNTRRLSAPDHVISNGKFFTSIHRFSSSDRLCKQSGHTCKELSIGYNTSNHRFVSITRSPGSTSLSENHSAPGRPIRCAAMMRNLFSMYLAWSSLGTSQGSLGSRLSANAQRGAVFLFGPALQAVAQRGAVFLFGPALQAVWSYL